VEPSADARIQLAEVNHMKRFTILALAVMALPAGAMAQAQSDVAYCKQLAGTYEEYVGRSQNSADKENRPGSLSGQVATTQCDQNTAESTRTLQQQLKDAKVDLPPR
jgi:hypothetical protein